MKKSISIALLLMLRILCASSQINNPIITAANFLTISPDARGAGMGDVGVATSPDVNSQYWNPAKYPFIDKINRIDSLDVDNLTKYPFSNNVAGISLSYNSFSHNVVSDISLLYLTGYYKISKMEVISASLRNFSLGEFKLMDQNGVVKGSDNPHEIAVDLSYSRLLSDKFSTAATLRFIYSDLNNGLDLQGGFGMYPGSSVALDLSAYYMTTVSLKNNDGTLAFGINISNIGTKISYDKNESSNFIPTNLRIGSSYSFKVNDDSKISVNADLNKLLVPTPKLNQTLGDYNKMSPLVGMYSSFTDAPGGFKEEMQEIMWSIGLEYTLYNQYFIRGGYFNENQSKGNHRYLTAGAGIKLYMFQLDASYVVSTTQSNPLDKALRFSLACYLNRTKN